MKHNLPPLPELLAFEASARHESFAMAAVELSLAQSTVSHRVRQLEERLGYKLFERLPRNLRLTEMGKAYLLPVRRAFEDLSGSTVGLFGPMGERQATLKIRSVITFGHLWLAPRLDQFMRRYPDINVSFNLSVWTETVAEDEMDVEIRFGHNNWPGLDAERLIDDRGIPLCSPAEAERLGPTPQIEELLNADLIFTKSLEDLWFRLFRNHGLDETLLRPNPLVEITISALELAAASHRWTIAPAKIAQIYIDKGLLVAPLDVEVPVSPGHYLLTPRRAGSLRPEVKLFGDWLREEFYR